MRLQANNVAQTCNVQMHATPPLYLILPLPFRLVTRQCTGVKSISYLVSGARALNVGNAASCL